MKIWSERNHRSFSFRKFFAPHPPPPPPPGKKILSSKSSKNAIKIIPKNFPLVLLHKHLEKDIGHYQCVPLLSFLSGVGFQYKNIFIKLKSFYFVKNYHVFLSYIIITFLLHKLLILTPDLKIEIFPTNQGHIKCLPLYTSGSGTGILYALDS